MRIRSAENRSFEIEVPVAIIGGGACGLVAALTLADAGIAPLVLERDAMPSGSTGLSSGMIPACGTSMQRQLDVEDTVEMLVHDIQAKAKGQADPAIARAVAEASGPTVEWLVADHGVELTLVGGFLYPGFSALRMHAPPSRQGADLMAGLLRAAEGAGIDIMTNARVTELFASADGRVTGLTLERPDGTVEDIGCQALILACNGYGGNPDMVRRHIPEMATAEYFGHPGNQGDAVAWGTALGAAVKHMGAYQGHGSVASPHGILITWALMMNGGIQINNQGLRFSNEHRGYSEQAVDVLAQPERIAWLVFDDRLLTLGREFEEFNLAEAAGAVCHCADPRELAQAIDVPGEALTGTLAETAAWAEGDGEDPFGRDFTSQPALTSPLHAIKVTGALFHTQGGLEIDRHARVLRPDGSALPNLYAGGGAACGVSGSQVWGYLSGNGLLTAVNLGRLAGQAAGEQIKAN
ncbi:MAG: FAD-dependent oxidoreductase [Rhodospirillaceae bacterium]|nr:FAD-dependent oxidoreductase [Rhodospirillaceae bacterium]MBT5899303.1 FAD-dependent oxidoreductase [Rhodospirillaceae bacterium]MBT7759025.1 FAD-dependent oxidoreductase [Rhodospirillaceae bacterium]